eukprot:1194584-Prorocentrum_minimum.AAC.2
MPRRARVVGGDESTTRVYGPPVGVDSRGVAVLRCCRFRPRLIEGGLPRRGQFDHAAARARHGHVTSVKFW